MDIQECVILKSVPGRGVVVELPSVEVGGVDRAVHDPGRAIIPSLVTARVLTAECWPAGFPILESDRDAGGDR